VSGQIYRIGYEGLTVEALGQLLTEAQVSLLVDVRLNPVSRKPGFSRKALAAALERAGIEYEHDRALGNPRENRDAFDRGDGEEGRRRMREILLHDPAAASDLEHLVERARRQRVAVLCLEKEPNRCHREVITDIAQEMDPSIDVVPLADD
jgi:uncharacterized protein (DUF488 family)